jgi:RNA polymerase sigma-70 factor (ECF subfamily)
LEKKNVTQLADSALSMGCAQAARLPAVEALVREYGPALIRFFERRTGNRAEAEDLSQEVFVRLAQHSGHTSVQHISAYVFQTARNLLQDKARYDASRGLGQQVSLENIVETGEGIPAERVYDGERALARTLEALQELPPKCRQVFLLHRFEGKTYRQIAKAFGISVSGVEKQIMRALLHLQRRIGPR